MLTASVRRISSRIVTTVISVNYDEPTIIMGKDNIILIEYVDSHD